MTTLAQLIKRQPLLTYFNLAIVGFRGLLPLADVAAALPLLIGAFVPALAAVLVTSVAEGKAVVMPLPRRVRIWRVGLPPYIAALGLPAITSSAAMVLALLLGSSFSGRAESLVVLIPMLAAFAVGEELGWRGFALPRLLPGQMLAGSSVLGAWLSLVLLALTALVVVLVAARDLKARPGAAVTAVSMGSRWSSSS